MLVVELKKDGYFSSNFKLIITPEKKTRCKIVKLPFVLLR